MKIKSGFIERDIAGWHIVVPVGQRASEFSAILSLNDTGCYIWKLLTNDISYDELLNRILEEYEVDKAIAKADLDDFLSNARKCGILDE